MLKIDLIVGGRLKSGPFLDLFQDYARRISWDLKLHEIESKQRDPAAVQREESKKMLEKIDDSAFIIALDERGKDLRSMDLARKIDEIQTNGPSHIQFIIGGADGLTDEIKAKGNLRVKFGVQTWPHMMVRVMLAEQIYRAQQILKGHPYHRE